MNISDGTTQSMCLVALKHVFPDVPVNGGAFRPARFTIPPGTILAAQYPSPVGGTTDVVQRVVDVVFAALAQAIPERVPAAPFGTTGVATVSGRHPETGATYVAVYPYPGGYGASRESDGLVNGTPPGSMAKFMSVEMSEHRYPLRFEHYAIREGSGGAGLHRGGCGSTYAITALGDCVVSILGDRVDHRPPGIEGGGPAAPNDVRLRLSGQEWVPPFRSKAERVPLKAGDTVCLASPGGGGYGDPLARDLALVEQDLNAGLIDRATAETTYVAVVAEARSVGDRQIYRLDAAASEERRRERRRVGRDRHLVQFALTVMTPCWSFRAPRRGPGMTSRVSALPPDSNRFSDCPAPTRSESMSWLELEGRTAIVTGAGGGIGRACARRSAPPGAGSPASTGPSPRPRRRRSGSARPAAPP